ncbi:hypothetical protein BN1723_000161, partial [Verticillium longisporum]
WEAASRGIHGIQRAVGIEAIDALESTGKQEGDMATWCSEAPHSLVGPSSLDRQTLRGRKDGRMEEEPCRCTLMCVERHSEALVLASLAASSGRIMAVKKRGDDGNGWQ